MHCMVDFLNDSDNKIQAKTFIMDLSESDFDGNDLGKFTFIGKRVLKRLLRQVCQYYKFTYHKFIPCLIIY